MNYKQKSIPFIIISLSFLLLLFTFAILEKETDKQDSKVEQATGSLHQALTSGSWKLVRQEDGTITMVMQGFSNNYGRPGLPVLPFKKLRILLPVNTAYIKADIESVEQSIHHFSGKWKCGSPISCDDEEKGISHLFDETKIFPEKKYKVIGTYKKGPFRYVDLTYYPVQILQKCQEMIITEEAEIIIKYKEYKPETMTLGEEKNWISKREARDYFDNSEDNMEDILRKYEFNIATIFERGEIFDEFIRCDFLIITSDYIYRHSQTQPNY